jgi:hypothetical protein
MNDLMVLTDLAWLAIVGGATGFITRLTKLYPKLPKGLVPYVALLVGYGITMGVLLGRGVPLADAWLPAFQGVLAGALSVLGHEAFKPLLVLAVGEKWATLILGKLPRPEPAPQPKASGATATILFLALGLASLAGGVSACHALLPALVHAANVANMVTGWVNLLDDAQRQWFAEHPDEETAAQFAAAIGVTRDALAALDRLGAASESYSEGDHAEAEQRLLEAYRELYAIAETIPGFLDSAGGLATPPDGQMARPGTPAELEAALSDG